MVRVRPLSTALTLALIAAPVFAATAQEYSQAPMFDPLVEAGELPPVAERLPKEPEVIEPMGEVGRYGGTIRRVIIGSTDAHNILRIVGPQGLVRWNPDFTEVIPNVAGKVEISDDGTAYDFTLRDGIKWSDGTPLSVDDVIFFVDDLLRNEDFYGGAPPNMYVAGGEVVEAEKIDDLTVRFTFAEPNGLFLADLAHPQGQHPVLYAKHYCSQFHPDYNPDVPQMVEEAGLADWSDLLVSKCGGVRASEGLGRWGNTERPTLDPWLAKEPYSGTAQQVVFERNPYFWQVDTDGQQLPYIDRVSWSVQQSVENLVLDVIAGRVDFQARHLDDLANKPLLAQNMEQGGYRLIDLISAQGQAMWVQPNLNHQDPTKRALLSDKEFRKALSLAIDREELIDLVWLGEGEPWQTGPIPGHALYNEQLGKQFTEYDPEQANTILDELGYTERDEEGFRLGPDGERIGFLVDTTNEFPAYIDALELIKQYWADIGIDVNTNTMERSLFTERSNSNDRDMAVRGGQGGIDPIISSHGYIATRPHSSNAYVLWTEWYESGGERGERPSDSMVRRLDLYDELRASPGTDRQNELMAEILQITAEEFETFGVTTAPNEFAVVNQDLRNVMEPMPGAWAYPTPAPALPQQWFYAE